LITEQHDKAVVNITINCIKIWSTQNHCHVERK